MTCRMYKSIIVLQHIDLQSAGDYKDQTGAGFSRQTLQTLSNRSKQIALCQLTTSIGRYDVSSTSALYLLKLLKGVVSVETCTSTVS